VAGQMILDIVRDVELKCRIQVTQTAVNTFIIRHLETDEVSSDIRRKISESFKTYMGEEVTVKYEKIKELTYDKSGKYRWFINEFSRQPRTEKVIQN
jgi:hypothetical protein